MSYLITLVIIVGMLFAGLRLLNPATVERTSESEDTPSGGATDAVQSAKDAVNLIEEKSELQTTLDLSNQSLTKAPDSLFNRTDIVVLDLSGNRLEGALQAEVRKLVKLRVLDLSNNRFTGVPAEVGQLTELRVLDLSNNPITGLPLEIGNLRNLKTLDLRGTNYSHQDLELIRGNLPASVEILVD